MTKMKTKMTTGKKAQKIEIESEPISSSHFVEFKPISKALRSDAVLLHNATSWMKSFNSRMAMALVGFLLAGSASIYLTIPNDLKMTGEHKSQDQSEELKAKPEASAAVTKLGTSVTPSAAPLQAIKKSAAETPQVSKAAKLNKKVVKITSKTKGLGKKLQAKAKPVKEQAIVEKSKTKASKKVKKTLASRIND